MEKIFRLENLVYLTIFALPSYLFRFSVWGVPTNLVEILILIIFLATLGKGYFSRHVLSSQKAFLVGISLLLFGFFLGVIWNGNYLEGLGIIKGWFILPIILAVCSSLVFDSFSKRKQALGMVFFSALGVATLALGYWALGNLTYDGRLRAFYESANQLAMYLSVGALAGVFLAKEKVNENAGDKNIYFSFLAIIFLALYFTYSYAAWLATILSLGIVLGIKRRKAQKTSSSELRIKKRVLISVGVIFLLILYSQIDSSKFSDLVSFSPRSSWSSRLMIWRSSGHILADNYFFGIGAGNFQDKYLEYQKYYPPYLEWAVPHPHNIFLFFYLYGGLIGFFGFIFLIFSKIKKLRLSWQPNVIEQISLVILLYFLLHGFFDATYFRNDMPVIFWLTMFL